MKEQESGRFHERFDTLRQTQEALARAGYYFLPVPREHTEALVTGPLLHRIRTQITKRSFARVAGHVAITFSGYHDDPRELYAIPEARAYWQALDAALPELPALLAALPLFGYNGPRQHLTLVGDIAAVRPVPAERRYEVQIADGPARIAEATARIVQAGRRYHLPAATVQQLVADFRRHVTGP